MLISRKEGKESIRLLLSKNNLFYRSLDIGSDNMKLGDIAKVRSGLVLTRKQSRSTEQYKYPLLNLRSIQEDGEVDMTQIEAFFASEPLNHEYITQPDDLIVRLTPPYTAVLIDDSLTGMVIPSSFAIIRIQKDIVLPEYLFWLLNTQNTKQRVYDNSTNNMYAGIKPSYFNDLDIGIISLKDQKTIATLNELARRETRLLRRLAEEKMLLYTRAIDEYHQRLK